MEQAGKHAGQDRQAEQAIRQRGRQAGQSCQPSWSGRVGRQAVRAERIFRQAGQSRQAEQGRQVISRRQCRAGRQA
jgi:hypothetical protein